MSPKEAIALVERRGVLLQAARGPVPSLAEAVAGEPICGSWWGHPRGKDIFRVTEAVCHSPDVLVCKLVGGRVSYVHRRLWPALVKLASRFPREHLARVRNEHTTSGAHRSRRQEFPAWVPSDVVRQAEGLSVSEAEALLSPVLPPEGDRARLRRTSRPTRG